jgi:hypothetical protein
MWPAAAGPRPAVQDRRTPAPVEGLMSAALAVLQMAAALEPDPVEAMTWYRSVPIAVLDGLTAAALVRQGRAHALLAFLCAAIEIDRAERRTLQ